ncbi:MAG TPA: hypothetical protein VK815_14720 [Candidatus Acidoferrales bacterium]|jgi:hypothetical protein|nr:hypothetical protein [Candidatus Acidoferrales bacterium]
MTKFLELKKPMRWLSISLLSFISALLMPYCEGRSNTVWAIPPLVPADLLPLVLLFISCIVLLVHWIRSLAARRRAFAAGLMFCGGLLLLVAWFAVDRWSMYQLGFRDYAKNVLTADEWRGISRFAQEHLKPEETLDVRWKMLWNDEKHRVLWSEFTASTQIQKLPPSLVIYVQPEYTEIIWGGALTGHRCVMVAASGNDAFQRGKPSRALFIATDIATVIED